MITLHDEMYYRVEDFELVANLIDFNQIKAHNKSYYYDLICAFDIETTSFILDDDETIINEDIYKYIKGTTIKVNNIDNINNYRLKLFPHVLLSNKSGIELDVFYSDLKNNFSLPNTTDPLKQLDIIVDILKNNNPNNDNKTMCSIMYVWQFAINGYVIIGRTWDEFIYLINSMVRYFSIDKNHRCIIYVHNLGMEFQYIRKLFKWYKVFSVNTRKPLFAVTTDGIEFRCSYLLSGYSLAKVAENLKIYTIQKLVGDLDYTLPRHSKTPLTDDEVKYCINDVLILNAYIQECCINDGDITKIPYTVTGYCRNYTRHQCLKAGGRKQRNKTFNKYHNLISNMRITSKDEYNQLLRSFAGGYTHASPIHSGKVLDNVDSFDFTSSYPYICLSELLPMSTGMIKKIRSYDEFKYFNKVYCTVFDVIFYGLKPTFINDNYISSSKCVKLENGIINNGRVSSADVCALTITNVDFEIIERTYAWDKIEINNYRVYRKGYLPKAFIQSIIKLYKDKTTLKGVEDKETEYQKSKGLLNSLYGMAATKPCSPEVTYDDNGIWSVNDVDIDKELNNYNDSKKRITFYAWAPFITAYARYNLWTGIIEFSKNNDYIYCDTDSIKCTNAIAHMDYINNYNNLCEIKLKRMCKFHNIDYDELLPKTIKGEVKPLGVWDWETKKHKYDKFKTLGAKRYMYTIGDELHITVAGVNKKCAQEYLLNVYGIDKVFDAFNEGLIIPADNTGKLTHHYIDDTIKGELIDYLGNKCKFVAPSGIYFEKASYFFNISSSYIDFLKGIQLEK